MNIWELIVVQPMTNILLLITMLVKNFGVAIILFTILIKLVTMPFTIKQVKSRRKMAELQSSPEYKKVMAKYKDDREKLAMEQQRLYKESGVSPFSSCLPLLLQMPIIFGLYQSIMRAMASTPVELLKLERIIYPFLDINKIVPIQNRFLWMDLGQPERLMVFGIGIPVLAILVVITTFLQSKAMEGQDANADPSAAAATGSMNKIMPLFMGYMAYQFSAGLALYFVVSNLTTMLQYAALGEMNWKSLMFWVKPDPPAEPVSKAKIIDEPEYEEIEKRDDGIVVIEHKAKSSARSTARKMRPKKMKK